MHSQLIQDIQREKDQLIEITALTPISKRTSKIIDGTGGKLSVADIIAYQIGRGKCLIRWYENGLKGEMPEMPGEGFSNWNYAAIAKYFYQKYQYDAADQQLKIFDQMVFQIIEIVKKEQQLNQLDQTGIWPWCTLTSGKQWPLSKWIRVNTAAPYKRAVQLIKKTKFI